MDHPDLIQFLENNLERQLHWIGAADSKAVFVFTLNTAMLGLLAAVAPASPERWTIAPAIFASFSVVLGLASLLFISFSAFPRTEGTKGSLIYFGGIAQRNLDQFKKATSGLTQDAYTDDLMSQCYRNAEIATRKFTWVQRALLCLYLSVIPWGLALFLLYSAGKL
jgi:hypothetical protein